MSLTTIRQRAVTCDVPGCYAIGPTGDTVEQVTREAELCGWENVVFGLWVCPNCVANHRQPRAVIVEGDDHEAH